ncbi:hypothetical protein L484_017376 [Morus notabilis]|uniref:Uncharacterized protein n=1 Tax=Morus notabilis TaxID=981085 RepID=W9R4T6_9ROSA|nr:hypothetical protein L484_017376 [Morus notabilis]
MDCQPFDHHRSVFIEPGDNQPLQGESIIDSYKDSPCPALPLGETVEYLRTKPEMRKILHIQRGQFGNLIISKLLNVVYEEHGIDPPPELEYLLHAYVFPKIPLRSITSLQGGFYE